MSDSINTMFISSQTPCVTTGRLLGIKLGDMQKAPSYKRLLAFAEDALKITSDADLARELSIRGYPTSAQRLNNWSRRGIPDAACLHIGKALGVDPLYLFFDDAQKSASTPAPLSLVYSENRTNTELKIAESDHDERYLIEAFRVADPGMKTAIMALAEKAKSTFLKRSEQND